jgi:hypothetical protein
VCRESESGPLNVNVNERDEKCIYEMFCFFCTQKELGVRDFFDEWVHG